MMKTFTTRALAIGLVFGMMAGAIVPAQAQGFPFARDPKFYPQEENPDRLPQLAICQTDYQVRRAFTEAGYDRVWLGGRLSAKRVQVKVLQGKKTFLFNYNRCTRQILDEQQVR